MKAYEYIKSKVTDKPADIIIKGQPFYRVENGYIPKTDHESIGIFEYAKQLNDDLEKGRRAEIGEIRERQGRKYKKVSDDKWAIVSESDKKKFEQEE